MTTASSDEERDSSRITVRSDWSEILEGRAKTQLETVLRNWLPAHRWFGAKARTIQSVVITDFSPLEQNSQRGKVEYLALLQVEYVEGEPETYLLPLGCACNEEEERMAAETPLAVITRLSICDTKQSGVVFDATFDSAFASALLGVIAHRRRIKEHDGELIGAAAPALRDLLGDDATLQPAPVKSEQSNTSIIYGDRAILKLFRRVEQGISPELEIGRFLTDEKQFLHVPAVLGSIEFRHNDSEPWTLGVLHRLMPHSEAAWQTTLDHLGHYFEEVLARPPDQWPTPAGLSEKPLWDLAALPTNALAYKLTGRFLPMAELLGQRTAELHLALGRNQ